MSAPEWEETPIGACTRDPERWTTRADEEAKAVCYSHAFCDAGDTLVERMFENFSATERRQFLSMLGRVRTNLDRIGE